MSAAAQEIARDDHSGQALAERWSLEYLKASAVSVDPRALSLLERGDCKRLRAIPLATGSGGALVAVCSPSEESFAAIRELTGEQTRFTLISEGTLEALLGSRMFAEAPATHPAPAAAPPQHEPPSEEEAAAEPSTDQAEAAGRTRRERGETDDQPPQEQEEQREQEEREEATAEAPSADTDAGTPPPAPDEPASAPDASVDNIVSAVLSALKHRVGSGPAQPADVAAEATALPGSTAELIAHLDSTVETWSAMRAALANVHEDFEETKRALRETKEQLSVAHADNDQYRKRVRTLETELAESRVLVTQARARLQEAADMLEADSAQLEESAEII